MERGVRPISSAAAWMWRRRSDDVAGVRGGDVVTRGSYQDLPVYVKVMVGEHGQGCIALHRREPFPGSEVPRRPPAPMPDRDGSRLLVDSRELATASAVVRDDLPR